MAERLKMIAFVLVLASVLTGSLVAVDAYTAPIIENNEAIRTKHGILAALGIDSPEDDAAGAFDSSVTVVEKKGQVFYVARDGSLAFRFTGSGLWGPITGVMAVLPELKTIKGVTIIRQEETPGLGGRIAEAEFLNRFRSKKLEPGLIVVAAGRAEGENEVDGITGATLSCNAFVRILNGESKRCLAALDGGRR